MDEHLPLNEQNNRHFAIGFCAKSPLKNPTSPI